MGQPGIWLQSSVPAAESLFLSSFMEESDSNHLNLKRINLKAEDSA